MPRLFLFLFVLVQLLIPALREEAKDRLNAVLQTQQTGEQIDNVLFTTFVVQH